MPTILNPVSAVTVTNTNEGGSTFDTPLTTGNGSPTLLCSRSDLAPIQASESVSDRGRND